MTGNQGIDSASGRVCGFLLFQYTSCLDHSKIDFMIALQDLGLPQATVEQSEAMADGAPAPLKHLTDQMRCRFQVSDLRSPISA